MEIVLEFLPPLDVLVGFLCIMINGVVLGALAYLPIAHKNSNLPLEKLSNDIIWRYAPDWFLMLIGCVTLLIISFMLLGGMFRV